jgi:ATP-dependent Clp protease ATP-binding subunit ClpA
MGCFNSKQSGASMDGCFTADARLSMQAAKELATRLGHRSVRIEHLLLGVLAEPGSVLDACHALGVRPSSIEQVVHSELARGNEARRLPRLPPGKVFDFARYESRMLEHNAIGTVHLTLAILRAASPQLLSALQEVGLYHDELRKELL